MARLARLSRAAWRAGTAASPSNMHAYRVKNLQLDPLEQVTIIDNDNNTSTTEQLPGRVGARYSKLSFDVELTPQEATATAPHIGALLRACGFAEATAGATYAAYNYTLDPSMEFYSTGSIDPIDIIVNRATAGASLLGLQEILRSAVGNCIFTWKAGSLAMVHFDFVGLISTTGAVGAFTSLITAAIADVAIVTSATVGTDFGTDMTAGITSNSAGSVATVASLRWDEVIYDVGNQVVLRPDINGDIGGYSAPLIAGRETAISMTIEAQLVATLNMYNKLVARDNVVVTFKHNAGAGAGSEIGVDFTCNLAGNITHPVIDGVLMLQFPAKQTMVTAGTYTNPLKLTWLSTA